MLDSFRHITQTWFGKILGVFLIVGLAGFGISNVIFQFGTNTVASVAGDDISVRDYQRAYDTQVNAVAQQYGRVPTAQEALALGVPSMVLDRLASEASINKFGEDLGLGVSEDRLGNMLRDDPTFSTALGAFDRSNFLRVLQQNGYTEAEYFDLQTKAARRQQLASGLFAGAPAPATAVELINRFSADTRTVDYFVLNAQALPPVAEPTEEELATYLKDHQADFRTKETRTVDFLALSPDTLAATKTISDADVAAEYERTLDSRVKIEKRTIRQIALTTPELEKAFTDGKAAGTPIADILAATGATAQDLGTLSKSEVTDSSLADTAFSLALDDYAIIDGIGSKRAVTVSAIEPGGTVSLEDAKAEIAKQLAMTQARNEYSDVLDQIEELRAAFKPLPEIADRFGLKTFTVALTEGGPELAQTPELAPEEIAKISSTVFKAQQGDLAPTVSLSSNRNFFFDLKQVDAARDQTLDEVHDAVKTAWTNAKTDEALTAEVTKITDQLKAGTPFADVATVIGQFPILSQPLKRGGDGTTVLNQTVANEIFNGGPTHFGSAVNGDGDHVVFQVAQVNEAAADATPDAKKFVEESTRDGLYADFVSGLKTEAGMRVNQQVMAQLLDAGAAQ
ncbi:MAG: PpiD [Devosia sp.]|uniref:peptidylprolyl isomerase n=1 Tax=Devosia sp. TaxID=1871048 RepID=UPI002605C390|nr:peptidylprolyl isomerase [Devosia sp.]MDB5542815.1 PpiD [Devosia sp.]